MVCKALKAYGEQQRYETAIEIAKKMIADNLSVEEIVEYTGLSKENVMDEVLAYKNIKP